MGLRADKDPRGATFGRSMTDDIVPFTVAVGDDEIADLHRRLDATRWPDQIPDSAWDYGADLAYVQSLCETWRHEFDWRVAEARINAFDNFTTTIDGADIHFIHARSPEPDATPLLITHGWPGSIAEFLDVIGPLRDPVAHGGDASDAFHVVAPSLPGYGFSGPTTEAGWDVQRVAEAWKVLMDRLGYDRYGAQGGDWGAMVTLRLATVAAEHLSGIHLNMALCGPAEGELTDQEQADLVAIGDFMATGTAYQEIQGKNPQTLSYGVTDSPAGLAGWIAEKFWAWTDNDGSPDDAITREQQLTNLSIYWFTKTANSSFRLYCESQRSGRFGPVEGRIDVPTGVAVFPKEIFRIPEAWARGGFDLRRYTRFDRGGHFAAFEEPDLFVDDVRAFFRDLEAS